MSKFKLVPVDLLNRQFHGDTKLRVQAHRELLELVRQPDKAFDEAAERAAFEAWHKSVVVGEPPHEKYETGNCDYLNAHVQRYWIGYLACAKRKAGGDL